MLVYLICLYILNMLSIVLGTGASQSLPVHSPQSSLCVQALILVRMDTEVQHTSAATPSGPNRATVS